MILLLYITPAPGKSPASIDLMLSTVKMYWERALAPKSLQHKKKRREVK